jgi:hypothetical protein
MKLYITTLIIIAFSFQSYSQQKYYQSEDSLQLIQIQEYHKFCDTMYVHSARQAKLLKDTNPYLALYYVNLNHNLRGPLYGNGLRSALVWFNEIDEVEFECYMKIKYYDKALNMLMHRDDFLGICDRSKNNLEYKTVAFENTVQSIREIFDHYRAKQSRADVYQSLYANMYVVIENEKECYPYLMTKYKEMSIQIPKIRCLSEKIEIVRKKLKAKQITKQQYLETIKKMDYLQYTIFHDVLMSTEIEPATNQ